METTHELEQSQACLNFAERSGVRQSQTSYNAVILAAGDYPTHPIALRILQQAPRIVCCDGAAQNLLDHDIIPYAIVGDGDSLPPHIKAQYPHLIHTIQEQEYNDLTKSTRFTIESLSPNSQLSTLNSQLKIAYLGCTGQREDHTLGNISLMAFYRREFHILPTMYTDNGFFTPACGTQTFPCFPRQQISIFRIHCKELTSEGLRWNSYPYTEWWQGTLNEAIGNTFTIHSDGEYIIYQTYEGKK